MKQTNPFRRGFEVEAHIDRGATRDARRQREVECESRATSVISGALGACDDELRPDLALALIAAATVAASDQHDPERIQAHLGKLAHERGAKIGNTRTIRRSQAEALFAKGGEE